MLIELDIPDVVIARLLKLGLENMKRGVIKETRLIEPEKWGFMPGNIPYIELYPLQPGGALEFDTTQLVAPVRLDKYSIGKTLQRYMDKHKKQFHAILNQAITPDDARCFVEYCLFCRFLERGPAIQENPFDHSFNDVVFGVRS